MLLSPNAKQQNKCQEFCQQTIGPRHQIICLNPKVCVSIALPIKIFIFKFQKLKTVLGKNGPFNTTDIHTLLQIVSYMFQPYQSVIIRPWFYKENVTAVIL